MAARLAHDNLEANARAANQVLQVEARSRFLCVLPLFHVGGLGILFRCRLAGATMLLHERFDADAVARDLRDGATHASLVASALARVLDQGAAFPPVIVAVGGGPVPQPLLDRARRAGLRVLQTWGMTETCSMITCERPAYADGATAGPPLPGFAVRVDPLCAQRVEIVVPVIRGDIADSGNAVFVGSADNRVQRQAIELILL